MKVVSVVVLLFAVALVNADVYMHYPRGGNNRLNENNQNRNNANRLFDSQNNNQGGYNGGSNEANAGNTDTDGRLKFYAGSVLRVEWTNQHGANNPNVNTQIVLQYMCDRTIANYNIGGGNGLRDGTNTNRIDNEGQTDRGRHETEQYYDDCKARQRNEGLFLADQTLNGNDAMYTRQNTDGTEYGFECAEERDYYPYWHNTPWIDVAVLTYNTSHCEMYQTQSQNVIAKNYCTDAQYNNQAACEGAGETWASAGPTTGVAPDCLELGWSRDNHLGDTLGGGNLNYNWTIPDENGQCVLRLRYNISTNDYDGWNTFSESNGENSPIYDNPTQNAGNAQKGMTVNLNLNTDQFFRTFQDRSHSFEIEPAPAGTCANGGTIYNLGVRGRRGNIVQTYPAVEYDFVPNDLVIGVADCVHLQWTGSTNTPAGAGQGAENTDKSNLVQIAALNDEYPLPLNQADMFAPAFEEKAAMSCYTGTPANLNNELDNAPATCDVGVSSVGGEGTGAVGTYCFLGTRNNNFSNRSQKGCITVVA